MEDKIIYATCVKSHDCGTSDSFIGKIVMKIEPGKAYNVDNFQFIRPCKKNEIVSFKIRRINKETESGFKTKICLFDVTIYNEDDTEYIATYNSVDFATNYHIIGDADDLLEYLKTH